ncbi:hypothetical protein K504DRAFT_466354 [Pleomassaria siparia CBS 279.74]|uniref:Uncharacterized protein n=1 Tax=Pleomassaria siparia CBS 279.74 TaxID=1314801 RepID=A0A6G1KB82_9PLEO|nr:hypothetical protein K504DRAFT_466354 [Pleomassaria siparia CBS 279.74]
MLTLPSYATAAFPPTEQWPTETHVDVFKRPALPPFPRIIEWLPGDDSAPSGSWRKATSPAWSMHTTV